MASQAIGLMSWIDFHLPFESSSVSVSFDGVIFIVHSIKMSRYLVLIGYRILNIIHIICNYSETSIETKKSYRKHSGSRKAITHFNPKKLKNLLNCWRNSGYQNAYMIGLIKEFPNAMKIASDWKYSCRRLCKER